MEKVRSAHPQMRIRQYRTPPASEAADSTAALRSGRKRPRRPSLDPITADQIVQGRDLPDPLIPFGVGNAGAVTLHQLHQRIARLAQAGYHLTNDGTMKGRVG